MPNYFGLEYNNVYNTQKVYLNVNNWLMLRGRQIFIPLFSQLLYEFKILQNKKLKLNNLLINYLNKTKSLEHNKSWTRVLLLEKEMATHSSVLAWRTPGKGEPGGLPSMGLHRVKTRLKRLSSSSSSCQLTIIK